MRRNLVGALACFVMALFGVRNPRNPQIRCPIMCRPQIGQLSQPDNLERQDAGKEGPTCLMPHPEIPDERIDKESPASDRKRQRESLPNASTCWTARLTSLRTCGT